MLLRMAIDCFVIVPVSLCELKLYPSASPKR